MKQWVLTTLVLMARLLPGYHYRQVRALRRQVRILHRHRHHRRRRHRRRRHCRPATAAAGLQRQHETASTNATASTLEHSRAVTCEFYEYYEC